MVGLSGDRHTYSLTDIQHIETRPSMGPGLKKLGGTGMEFRSLGWKVVELKNLGWTWLEFKSLR